MIDPRFAWFTMGATCGAVAFGWPWHPRFSLFSHENTAPDSREARPRKFRDIRSINYPDPSPDRRPTNPFTGKPIRPKARSPRIIRKDFLP